MISNHGEKVSSSLVLKEIKIKVPAFIDQIDISQTEC